MTSAIDFISSSFSIEHCNVYSLSIREFPNGFSFSVTEQLENRCIAIKFLPSINIRKVLMEEPLLQLPFKQVIVMRDAPFCIVPDKLFDDNLLREYLPISSEKKNRIEPNFNCTSLECKVIFDAKRYPKLNRETIIMHPITSLLNMASQITNSDFLLCEITEKSLNLIAIKSGKLKLTVSYESICADDNAYYIMLAIQQLNLDVQNTPIYLCGATNKLVNPIHLLKPYIKQIDYLTPPNHWNETFQNEYYPYFATQITAPLCV